jgi:hypothetical protein
MSLESGTVSLRRFYTSKSLPHRSSPVWLEKLKEFSLKERELEQDMEVEGWSVMGNELSIDFNEQNIKVGPYIMFSFRCDTHRVAMNVVELHLKSQVSLAIDNKELVNRQTENAMKEDIIKDLLSQTLPSIEIASVLVDTHGGVVYYTSGSERLIDKLCLLFLKTFDITLLETTYETAAARLLDNDEIANALMNLPGTLLVEGLQLHPDFMEDENSRTGSSFLTWFFYYLQSSESLWVSEDIEEVYVVIESELSLAGETFGSREVTIKKGEINNCKELVAAFSAGKRISKLRFLFYRGDEDNGLAWSFTMDKKNFSILSLKPPKVEAVDTFGMKMERFDNICEIHEIMDDIYRDYLNLKTSKAWLEIEQDMRDWLIELDEINNPKKEKNNDVKKPETDKAKEPPITIKVNEDQPKIETKITEEDNPTDEEYDKSDNVDSAPKNTVRFEETQPLAKKSSPEISKSNMNQEDEKEIDSEIKPYTISQEELDESMDSDEN